MNENEYHLKCYKKNIDPDNPCQICGNNYFIINGIINNTYINCYENYYTDTTTYQVSIETSINNENYYINDTSYRISFDNPINNTTGILLNTNNIYNYTNTNLIGDYSFFDSSVIIEKEIEIINRTELIGNMINNLFDKLNISNIDSGKDEKTGDNNISVIITSTTNQKKNENEKMITMDLGQCETSLKYEYNISSNAPLYILQIISEEESGMKIPKIEYEIYYPFNNNNNLEKLDLNLCKGIKIEISIPVKLSDNLDKHNPKSCYYNDICYTATSESGTDISLNDRKNEFVENNMTLCEENCKLIEYNKDSKKSKCSCDIKLSIPLFEDIKFNKDEFYKSFTDLKNMLNLNVMKCYKKVFNKTLINNYGFFIMIFIFILYFLCLFIFLFHSHKKLFKDINDIMTELNYNKGVGLKKIYRKKIIRKNLISSINNDKKTKIDKIIFLNNENQEKDKSNKQIIETGYNNRIINFKNISDKSKDILDYKD